MDEDLVVACARTRARARWTTPPPPSPLAGSAGNQRAMADCATSLAAWVREEYTAWIAAQLRTHRASVYVHVGHDAATSGGVLPALVDALARKPTAASHVDSGAKLGDIRLSDLPSACWPSPASRDWLDAQAPTRARCIALRSRAAPRSGVGA